MYYDDIAEIAKPFLTAPGDVMELGVMSGTNSRGLAEILPASKTLWLLDTFCGMPEPGEHDGDRYPKGRFDQGGVEAFRRGLGDVREDQIILVEGLVQETVPKLPGDLRLCFAYVDLDHYEPTAFVLPRVWEMLRPGGLMLCDDWEPPSDQLASRAIEEFLEPRWSRRNGVVGFMRPGQIGFLKEVQPW